MKTSLIQEFDVPEEQSDLEWATHVSEARSLIWDFDQFIRGVYRGKGPTYETVEAAVEGIAQEWFSLKETLGAGLDA